MKKEVKWYQYWIMHFSIDHSGSVPSAGRWLWAYASCGQSQIKGFYSLVLLLAATPALTSYNCF